MENTKVIDITKDAGFEQLVSMVKEGSLSLLKEDTDIDLLVQKQAYADADIFADPSNRMFSIATPTEAYISARYAEKYANYIGDDVIAKINEACDVFNIPVTVAKTEVAKVANEMFTETYAEAEKYASAEDYGTEFENAIAARIMTLPEHAEDYEQVANLASEVPAHQMVNLLREIDSFTGADLPWVQNRVGSPEYAVFEKKASALTVNLGLKTVSFEKLAMLQDAMNDMGIDIDFDANDMYTTKLAIERLPVQIRNMLSKLV